MLHVTARPLVVRKSRKTKNKAPLIKTSRATVFDRLADLHLQQGYHQQAERLAHRAAALRQAGAQ